MTLQWKVEITQEGMDPIYNGRIILSVEEENIRGEFTFHCQLELGYRMTADDHPFLEFTRNNDEYVKVRLPVTQGVYSSLPDEKTVMLDLMQQMVRAGVAGRKTAGKVKVEDLNVQAFIRTACAEL